MTNDIITPNTVAKIVSALADAAKPRTVAELKATKTDTPVKLTRGQVRNLRYFNSAKRAEAKAKKRKDKYSKLVFEALGDAAAAVNENGSQVLELGFNINTTYDAKILTERFPEAEVAARRPAPYAIIRSTI